MILILKLLLLYNCLLREQENLWSFYQLANYKRDALLLKFYKVFFNFRYFFSASVWNTGDYIERNANWKKKARIPERHIVADLAEELFLCAFLIGSRPRTPLAPRTAIPRRRRGRLFWLDEHSFWFNGHSFCSVNVGRSTLAPSVVLTVTWIHTGEIGPIADSAILFRTRIRARDRCTSTISGFVHAIGLEETARGAIEYHFLFQLDVPEPLARLEALTRLALGRDASGRQRVGLHVGAALRVRLHRRGGLTKGDGWGQLQLRRAARGVLAATRSGTGERLRVRQTASGESRRVARGSQVKRAERICAESALVHRVLVARVRSGVQAAQVTLHLAAGACSDAKWSWRCGWRCWRGRATRALVLMRGACGFRGDGVGGVEHGGHALVHELLHRHSEWRLRTVVGRSTMAPRVGGLGVGVGQVVWSRGVGGPHRHRGTPESAPELSLELWVREVRRLRRVVRIHQLAWARTHEWEEEAREDGKTIIRRYLLP